MGACGTRGVWSLRPETGTTVTGVLLFALLTMGMPAAAQNAPRLLGGRPDFALRDLPVGAFRDRLERLPTPARERALAKLRAFSFPELDARSLRVDDEGGVFYADEFPVPAGSTPAANAPTPRAGAVLVSPFPASTGLMNGPARMHSPARTTPTCASRRSASPGQP